MTDSLNLYASRKMPGSRCLARIKKQSNLTENRSNENRFIEFFLNASFNKVFSGQVKELLKKWISSRENYTLSS